MKYNKKFGSRVKALCLEAMIATNLTVLALPTETSINTSITPTPALSGEYFDRGENLKLESEYEAMAREAAEKNGIQISLVYAVVEKESEWNPHAQSERGAYGFMQLMPETAKERRVNRYDPEQNLHGGTEYLAELITKYGNIESALVAYNWGPGNVDRLMRQYGQNWYQNTPSGPRNFARKVLNLRNKYERRQS